MTEYGTNFLRSNEIADNKTHTLCVQYTYMCYDVTLTLFSLSLINYLTTKIQLYICSYSLLQL